MLVSIIIINYNTFTLTCNCIRSVIQHTHGIDYEIILVDNASTETDPEEFIKLFPEVKLITSKTNSGFAAGNNLGINAAKGNYILLLNSDTYLQDDAISATVRFASGKTAAGVVGCRMTFPDGRVQFTARRFRSIEWELLDLFRLIPYAMSYSKRATLMLGKYFCHDENIEADWVNGAFFLFQKNLLSQLPGGKLDDRFFMYGEDHLWCWQINKLGYQNWFFAGATIIHINSGSTDVSRQLRLKKVMMQHELEIMRLRETGSLQYALFKIIFTLKEAGRLWAKKLWFKLTGKVPY